MYNIDIPNERGGKLEKNEQSVPASFGIDRKRPNVRPAMYLTFFSANKSLRIIMNINFYFSGGNYNG